MVSCEVLNGNGPDFGTVAFEDASLLDGGSSFVIKGPSGSMTVAGGAGDNVPLGGNGSFLVPGDYTITGSGGKDIGAFTASITLPPFPTLTSPSPGNLILNRAQGVTVNWTPNGSNGHVEIALFAADSFNISKVNISCTAPISAGTFTIPPYVTLALPPTSNAVFSFQPGDNGPAASAIFTASGLTLGLAQIFASNVVFTGVQAN